MKKYGFTGVCAGLTAAAALLLASTPALAVEGIASQGKSLGGLSDGQCLSKVDRVIASERRASDSFLRVVSGRFTRKMVFTDGSVDFACFPNQVVIIVYFSNAGNGQAEADLRNFLSLF